MKGTPYRNADPGVAVVKRAERSELSKLSLYQIECLEQTTDWVNGVSKHNKVRDECVPDFSCCLEELFEEDREKRIEVLNKLREEYHLKPFEESDTK